MPFGLEKLSDRTIAAGCFLIATSMYAGTLVFARPPPSATAFPKPASQNPAGYRKKE